MDWIVDLWLPILVATVAMFFASFVVWTLMPHHNSDYRRLPDEDGVLKAMREKEIPAGQYMFPHCIDMKEMQNEEMKAKWEQGPAGFVTVLPRGMPNMGRNLGLTILYDLVVALIIGYLASITVAKGASFMDVFRVVGTIGILTHAAGFIPTAIWFGRPLKTTLKEIADGVAYGIVTGLIFALLWPSAALPI